MRRFKLYKLVQCRDLTSCLYNSVKILLKTELKLLFVMMLYRKLHEKKKLCICHVARKYKCEFINELMNTQWLIGKKNHIVIVYSSSVWSFMGFSDGKNTASLLLQYL